MSRDCRGRGARGTRPGFDRRQCTAGLPGSIHSRAERQDQRELSLADGRVRRHHHQRRQGARDRLPSWSSATSKIARSRFPLDSIEAKKEGGSIMPVGLADELTRGRTGRPGSVSFRTGQGRSLCGRQNARSRGAGMRSPTTAESFDPNTGTGRSPGSEVDERLQHGCRRPARVPSIPAGDSKQRVVRCQVEAAVGGKVEVRARRPDREALAGWKAAGRLPTCCHVELSTGMHTFTLVGSRRSAGQAAG